MSTYGVSQTQRLSNVTVRSPSHGPSQHVIIVDDSDHTQSVDALRGVENINAPLTDSNEKNFIDLDNASDDEIIDLTGDDIPVTFDHIEDGYEIPPNYEELDWFPWESGNQKLEPGCDVELKDGAFLRILLVLQSSSDIHLRGILLKRNSDINVQFWTNREGEKTRAHDLLPLIPGELCAIVQTESGECDLSLDQGLVTRPLKEVLKLCHIAFTNSIYEQPSKGKDTKNSHDALSCRWKYIGGGKKTAQGFRTQSWQLLHLSPAECDPGQSVPDYERMQQYQRHDTHSAEPTDAHCRKRQKTTYQEMNVIDLTSEDEEFEVACTISKASMKRLRTQGAIKDHFGVQKITSVDPCPVLAGRQNSSNNTADRKITYADFLCGAGGMTCGADQAGLQVKYALDNDLVACETLRRNMPLVKVHREDLTDWIVRPSVRDVHVDVMHVSFCCQAFSRANPGTNIEGDQQKVDLGYALYELARKVRPRVITLEQVDGILDNDKQGGHHLFAQMQDLTRLGFQLRCKALSLADYGVPQTRKRLMLIAACPGQTLPPWPEPTHGDGAGLLPRVTIQDALAQVPWDDQPIMEYYTKPAKAGRYDARRLANTVTCSGQGTHPSGDRSLTLRETSNLQTFAVSYHFSGKICEIRRQIGNAVPPVFGKALFEPVVQAIRQTDAAFARRGVQAMNVNG